MFNWAAVKLVYQSIKDHFTTLVVIAAILAGFWLFHHGKSVGVDQERTANEKQQAADRAVAQKVLDAMTAQRDLLQAKLAEDVNRIDATYQQGVKDGQSKTDALVSDLRSNNLRLSVEIRDVRAESATTQLTARATVDYATRRAELSERSAEYLLRLTGRADNVARQLGSCQAYVRTITKAVTDYNQQMQTLSAQAEGKKKG